MHHDALSCIRGKHLQADANNVVENEFFVVVVCTMEIFGFFFLFGIMVICRIRNSNRLRSTTRKESVVNFFLICLWVNASLEMHFLLFFGIFLFLCSTIRAPIYTNSVTIQWYGIINTIPIAHWKNLWSVYGCSTHKMNIKFFCVYLITYCHLLNAEPGPNAWK